MSCPPGCPNPVTARPAPAVVNSSRRLSPVVINPSRRHIMCTTPREETDDPTRQESERLLQESFKRELDAGTLGADASAFVKCEYGEYEAQHQAAPSAVQGQNEAGGGNNQLPGLQLSDLSDSESVVELDSRSPAALARRMAQLRMRQAGR